MQKLQALKKKKAEETSKSKDNNDESTSTTESTGFVLKKENSEELAASRKAKSKERVLSLQKDPKKGGKGKKQDPAQMRLTKDITEMEPVPGTRLEFPDPDNLMEFNVYIKPLDGLYKDAEFKFTVTCPKTYPYDPPKAVCNTLIYHPNIDFQGAVCLNILRADWRPVLTLGHVVYGLMLLFVEPNPDDPLNHDVAKLMIDNRASFEANVRTSLRGGSVGGRTFPKLL
jgi:ubiquitin-conjugating enzyme E2 M